MGFTRTANRNRARGRPWARPLANTAARGEIGRRPMSSTNQLVIRGRIELPTFRFQF
jgi:hypothetical protein